MQNGLISEAALSDYLGVDDESYETVSLLRDAAMDDLRRSTGITEQQITNFGLVNEYVMCSVYLSFMQPGTEARIRSMWRADVIKS